MKHQLDITKGKYGVADESSNGVYVSVNGNEMTAVMKLFSNNEVNKTQCSNNTILAIDSFDTYQSCGYLPSELLRQRDELKKACEHLLVNLEARVKGVEHKDWLKTFFAKEIKILKNLE